MIANTAKGVKPQSNFMVDITKDRNPKHVRPYLA